MPRIEAFGLARAEIAFRRPFVISSGAIHAAVSVLVALRDEDGLVGYGETTTQTPYTGATEAGLNAALRDWLLPAIRGLDYTSIQGLHRAMNRALRGNDLAKAAVDIAAWDLLGKRLGVPVHQLLGGAVRDTVPIGWSIGLGTIDEMVAEAETWADRGLAVKVKIGGDPDADLAAVRAIRQTIGPAANLRVDANAGYSVTTALRVLPRMEECGLTLIEQPVAQHDLAGAARVRDAVSTPILADESQHTPHDTMRIIQSGAADAVNTKILKPGGLRPSLQVGTIAEIGGLEVMVGSMPEMGLATAAGLHFAAACPPAVHPAELIGPLMLADDILAEPLPGRNGADDGRLRLPTGPGLGVSLRDDIEFDWR